MNMELTLLANFLSAIRNDPRIGPTHVGMYASFLYLLKQSDGVQPIIFKREQIMSISRISAPATYHSVLRDLNENGYVRYEASYSRKGNKLFLMEIKTEL